MTHDPDRHHRQSMRLRGRDYARAGGYFVTVCVQDRECLFGDVVAGAMQLNAAGRMVRDEWLALPLRYPSVRLDAFVVMPNHLHAIVVLGNADGAMHPGRAATRAAPTQEFGTTPTLATVIGAYKSITTLRYTRGVDAGYWRGFRNRLWQRGYHEEVLRDGPSWAAIRGYIADNPVQWADDREHPGRELVGAVREAGRS